eukprot:jgi/Chrpa1/27589/Chrysochromulina_OHIO_Genome00008054-RA
MPTRAPSPSAPPPSASSLEGGGGSSSALATFSRRVASGAFQAAVMPGTWDLPTTPTTAPGTWDLPTTPTTAPGTWDLPTTPTTAPGTWDLPTTPTTVPTTAPNSDDWLPVGPSAVWSASASTQSRSSRRMRRHVGV